MNLDEFGAKLMFVEFRGYKLNPPEFSKPVLETHIIYTLHLNSTPNVLKPKMSNLRPSIDKS